MSIIRSHSIRKRKNQHERRQNNPVDDSKPFEKGMPFPAPYEGENICSPGDEWGIKKERYGGARIARPHMGVTDQPANQRRQHYIKQGNRYLMFCIPGHVAKDKINR